MKFSVLISLGPSPFELKRIEDIVESLSRCEAENFGLLVIADDNTDGRNFDFLRPLLRSAELKVVYSPRGMEGDTWRGGLATNYMSCIADSFAASDIEMCLVLDSDAAVLRPFSQKAQALLANDPSVGLVGSCYGINPQGQKVAPSMWDVSVRKWSKAVRLRRLPFPRIETGLFGRNRVIRSLTLEALSNGWPIGSCIQGGAMIMSRSFFSEFQARGLTSQPLLWQHTDLTYDVILSLLCHAFGLKTIDHNQEGEIFGVQYRGLPFDPEELCHRGYSLVHSLKTGSESEETDLRERLRALVAAS